MAVFYVVHQPVTDSQRNFFIGGIIDVDVIGEDSIPGIAEYVTEIMKFKGKPFLLFPDVAENSFPDVVRIWTDNARFFRRPSF